MRKQQHSYHFIIIDTGHLFDISLINICIVTSLPKVIGKRPRRGAVAHVRRKVPTGYNGAPQIRPKKYPFPWTDPQTPLFASSLDPPDL